MWCILCAHDTWGTICTSKNRPVQCTCSHDYRIMIPALCSVVQTRVELPAQCYSRAVTAGQLFSHPDTMLTGSTGYFVFAPANLSDYID